MKTYQQVFAELKSQRRPALIPFFVIGDPDYATSLAIVKAAMDAGPDILELGIPFSDPIADGPTIQKADVRAIRSGMNTHKALEFIRELRACRSDIPIGLLMYYNLIHQYGVEKFFRDFHDAGVNSVLVADLSIDDAQEVVVPARAAGLEHGLHGHAKHGAGPDEADCRQNHGLHLYRLAARRHWQPPGAFQHRGKLIATLKSVTSVPVCVGFGVSTPEHAATIAKAGADGVIIGSRLVAMIEGSLDAPERASAEITAFLRQVQAAVSVT